MKKWIIFLLVMLIKSAGIAQDIREDEMQQFPKKESNVISTEVVYVKDGKVWLSKDGKETLVTNEVRIGGVKVDAFGKVIRQDGTGTYLKEGDRITADGKIEKSGAIRDDKDPK